MSQYNHFVRITQASVYDLPKLQTLYTETIENICVKDYGPEQIAAWTAGAGNLERWLTAIKTQYFLVARTGSTVTGFGSLKDGEYIDFLYVHKDYQGTGVAGKIYARLEQRAAGLGKRELTADVSRTARAFFEKKGFEVQRENQNLIRGVTVINYRMKKTLV
ncbi:MAG TPA: GNAT family N-acetyltransferase [Sphingobacteriaceae bacterium]